MFGIKKEKAVKTSVYMINGFLDSGKTEFIKYTLGQDYFSIDGTTLLILCEEGEVEYDEKLLKRSGTVCEIIEDEEDFTKDALEYLGRRYEPERVVIEFNGMWNPKNIELPENWVIEQQITTINAATFSVYYTNMKSLVSEQVKGSELIIFNRCDGIEDLPNYKRSIKAVNGRAEIIFEDANGEINVSLAEDLPYDLDAEVIKLDDAGYAIWYIDAMDNPARYDGKIIEYVGTVMKPATFPKQYFVPGRMAMTCCAEDMAFLGYVCKYEKADEFKEHDWIIIRAKISLEFFEPYGGIGPVLIPLQITKTSKPKDEIIDFSRL